MPLHTEKGKKVHSVHPIYVEQGKDSLVVLPVVLPVQSKTPSTVKYGPHEATYSTLRFDSVRKV